jgi:hypothetical protein
MTTVMMAAKVMAIKLLSPPPAAIKTNERYEQSKTRILKSQALGSVIPPADFWCNGRVDDWIDSFFVHELQRVVNACSFVDANGNDLD